MSKMKHLLRILHIGGNCEVNQGRHAPASSASSSSSTIPDSADHGRSPERPPRAGDLGNSPSLLTPGMVRLGSAAVNERDDALNFNLLEEEYQMQLALAISASDPNTNEDPESIQMKAVKRISLGCSPSPGTTLVEFLSLRYWKYNVVNYDEKVSDGFYDVFGVIHDPTSQGKFPSLMELQSRSFVDVMSYEIVLVNRLTDTTLQRLEQTASCIAVECHAFELGPVHSGLIQKIADLVVDNMGGPVNDADEMSKQWTERSYQLKASLNSIVLPLGCLNIGLSRHRALLFKVLADKINLPCRLVKGSYYTDTDDGAVNMIKIDHDSEFIIDLMGAPGTLIPAEISSSHPQIAPSDTMCSDTISQTIQELCLALDNNDPRSGTKSGGLHLSSKSSVCPPTIHSGSSEGVICCDEPVGIDIALSQSDRAEKFESKCPPPFGNSCKILARTTGTPAQQKKVNDVSKYVISAAQDPQFAQKLHAVLLESGASPPPDLFSDMNLTQVEGKDFNPEPSISVGEDSCFEDCASSNHNMRVFPTACLKPETDDQRSVDKQHSDTAYQIIPYVANSRMVIPFSNLSERRLDLSATNDARKDQTDEIDGHTYPQCNEENINDHAMDRKMVRNDQRAGTISYNGKISPEFAEWEISWEDLQIGERIGLVL